MKDLTYDDVFHQLTNYVIEHPVNFKKLVKHAKTQYGDLGVEVIASKTPFFVSLLENS